jgi:hypothetical protein
MNATHQEYRIKCLVDISSRHYWYSLELYAPWHDIWYSMACDATLMPIYQSIIKRGIDWNIVPWIIHVW